MKKPEKRGPLSLFPRLFYRGNAKKRQKMHFFSLFSIFSKKSEKMLKIDFSMSVASSWIKKRKKTQKNAKKHEKNAKKKAKISRCKKVPKTLHSHLTSQEKSFGPDPQKSALFCVFSLFLQKSGKNAKKRQKTHFFKKLWPG